MTMVNYNITRIHCCRKMVHCPLTIFHFPITRTCCPIPTVHSTIMMIIYPIKPLHYPLAMSHSSSTMIYYLISMAPSLIKILYYTMHNDPLFDHNCPLSNHLKYHLIAMIYCPVQWSTVLTPIIVAIIPSK